MPETPATWENVVVGEAKKILGHLVGDKEYADEGEGQIELAHEVREEFREEHEQ